MKTQSEIMEKNFKMSFHADYLKSSAKVILLFCFSIISVICSYHQSMPIQLKCLYIYQVLACSSSGKYTCCDYRNVKMSKIT